MFGPRIFSGLSFTRVLGGISKTLNVVNQVIPIYKQAKPMISNARNALSLIKEFGNSTTTRVMEKTNNNLKDVKEKIQTISKSSNQKGPTFFQ